jgi:hypothetical protein
MKELTENQKRIFLVMHEGIYGKDHLIGDLTQEQINNLVGCCDYISRISQSRERWRAFGIFCAVAAIILVFVMFLMVFGAAR